MQLFCIGDKDFTNFIEVPSYKVNRYDLYLSWNDANHVQHRQMTRTKVSGSFTMFFSEITEFLNFLEIIKVRKNQALYIPNCQVYCNNLNQIENVDLFISYNLSNYIPLFGSKDNQGFEVTIEER